MARSSIAPVKSPSISFGEFVDKITVSQVEEAVKKALKSRPVIFVSGGDVSTLGSYDSLASKFA